MITKNIKTYLMAGLVCSGITAAISACSDTWDEHYDTTVQGVHEGSIWQAIKQNPNLSNFASVAEACGYDKSLASSQVFTVFAPTNDAFSAAEAAQLIEAYKAEKGKVNDDENTTIKEFLQNHIALYNHSVATTSNDTIVMMNGKYKVLGTGAIGDSKFLTKNELYSNGVLFVVDNTVDYFPNVFEYVRKDADLDSVASFLYNERFYRSEFQAEKSVAGGIVDGKTVYLDSVFQQQNDLFGYQFLSARLSQEDSTYWMVAPTNELWKQLVDEYSNYFYYDPTVDKRDSIAYTNTRMGIMGGLTFSLTNNPSLLTPEKADSAISTLASTYQQRQSTWGLTNPPHYYQFGDGYSGVGKPFQPGGVFHGVEYLPCSNGQVLKTSEWNVNPLNTFNTIRVIRAASQGVIREVSKVQNSSTGDMEETVTPTTHQVQTDNEYYGLLWGNSFVEFAPAKTTLNHTVIFNISNVLSNMGYDIYLVTAPALASDSNATAIQRLPTKIRCKLGFHNADGASQEETLVSVVETQPDIVDYILLAEDFKFPAATYGLTEDETQVSLSLETRVSSTEQRTNAYTRTMRINSILLVPHGMALVKDNYFLFSFHNNGWWWLPMKPTSAMVADEPAESRMIRVTE